jgi:HAD superfamily hydrolase (TIGR01450 family)
MRRVSVLAALRSSDRPLAESFDVALLDLDGVVYLGHQPIAGAQEALGAARAAGMRLAFVTNNAARPPGAVADLLRGMGIPAEPDEVVTSAQAAAHYLADRLPAGANVLVVGTTGLVEALAERGLSPVRSADEHPAAVVQGYSDAIDWGQLAEGAVAIRTGIPWVATNLDATVPSPRGPLPGNGSLVMALQHATGRTPVATGKPDPTMHRESVQRSGAQRPLVVGDRLDTDIEGANAAGCPSLLVLTGVTTAAILLTARPELRPSFVAADLAGLLQPHVAPRVTDAGASGSGWVAVGRADGSLLLGAEAAGADGQEPDVLDALRVLCVAAWHGGPGGSDVQAVEADGERAAAALRALELG